MTQLDAETIVAPCVHAGVPWNTYRDLRQNPELCDLRMTYLDGTLIFMSPELLHEDSAELLGQIFRAVANVSGLSYRSVRSTTLWRTGRGQKKGSGKEPDTSFYVGASVARMKGKTRIDLKVDPPPDLAIEVINKADSPLALPLYARLGVPEVWVHDAREDTLWFGRLDGPEYATIDRSICLPRLTPALVLQALAAFRTADEDEYAWNLWLQDWARALPTPPDRG